MSAKAFLIPLLCATLLLTKIAGAQTISVGTVNGAISGCVGTASLSPNIQQFSATGSGLTSNVSVTAPSNFEVAASAGGPYAGSLNITPAGGSVSTTIYVRSSQSAPVGSITGNVSLSSTGATTKNVSVNGTVNALPTVNPVANQTLTNGQTTNPISFTGTSKAFDWINDNPSIGLSALGSGNLPGFTATNLGNAAITANITVTPVPTGFIYTANHLSNNVTVINTGNNNVITTIPVGQEPFKAVVSPDGDYVYVVNFGISSNNISVIDAKTNTVIATIPVGPNPKELIFNKDGSRAYVLDYNNDGGVSVINTTTNTVIATIATPINPQYLAISPDGSHIYVVAYGTTGNGKTYTINALTNAIEATIPISGNIGSILFSPDGSKMYVLNRSSNAVIVVNTSSNNIITTLPVGNYPANMVLTADGNRLYVANQLSNNISIINTTTNTIIGTANSANYLMGIALSRDEKYLYVPGRRSGSVYVMSTTDYSTVKIIPIDGVIDNPVLSPDGSKLYVTTDDGKLNIINTTTNDLIITVPTGTNPQLETRFISKGNGCSGNPVTFTITVNPSLSNPPTSPGISTSGSLSALTTTFGTPSATTSFNLSGTNLTSPISVAAPAGFEVSTDNSTFSPTITVGNTGNASATIYVRLSKTTNAGSYNGNIKLSGTSLTSVSVNIPNSTVNPAPLTINAPSLSKPYGTTAQNGVLTSGFIITGLQNQDNITSVMVSYNNGASASSPVGIYSNSVSLTSATGSFNKNNYTINYQSANLEVIAVSLVIMAENKSKMYGVANPALTVRYVGFVNNDDQSVLTKPPIISTMANQNSPSGTYPINVSGALAPNYIISYISGTLTIEPGEFAALTFPNLFTPNGDGVNDTWQLKELVDYPSCLVRIFNRNGELIYNSVGYSVPWDGKYKGVNVPAGTYYYIILPKNGKKEVGGYVTVIR